LFFAAVVPLLPHADIINTTTPRTKTPRKPWTHTTSLITDLFLIYLISVDIAFERQDYKKTLFACQGGNWHRVYINGLCHVMRSKQRNFSIRTFYAAVFLDFLKSFDMIPQTPAKEGCR
jgi:hypothetical protein